MVSTRPRTRTAPTCTLSAPDTRTRARPNSLFANRTPDPVRISLDYLALCAAHPATAPLPAVRAHVRHFLAPAW